MSACGQGDVSGDLSEDAESEIVSTTCDNGGIGGMKPSFSGDTRTVPVPIGAGSTAEPLEPLDNDPTHVITTTERVYDGTDTNKSDIVPIIVASARKKLKKDLYNESASIMARELDHVQDSATTTTKEVASSMNIAPEDVKDNVKDIIPNIKHDACYSKEIAEVIQADSEKDSNSLSEEIELRWDDDDYDENDETTPTDDVLKLLDRELGIIDDASEIPQDKVVDQNRSDEVKMLEEVTVDQNEITDATKKHDDNQHSVKIKDLNSLNENLNVDEDIAFDNDASDASQLNDQKTDKSNDYIKKQADENDDVGMNRDSFDKKSQKHIDIDNFTEQVIEMETSIANITGIVENPKITDKIDSVTKTNSDQDIEIKKGDSIVDTLKPSECSITRDKDTEITSESSLKTVVEEMDLDILTEETKKESIVYYPSIPIDSTKDTNLNEKENNVSTPKEAVSHNDEVLDDNKDIVQKVSEEITILEHADINKTNSYPISIANKDVEIDVSKLNKPNNSRNDHTASHVPIVNKDILPMQDSNFSHKVIAENEDNHTSEIPSESTMTQQLAVEKKYTPGTDDMHKIDDQEKCYVKEIAEVNTSQLLDDSAIDTTISPNINHRINKPNVMLDIPTQEMSDIEAELDDDLDSELFDEENDNKKATQQILKMDTSVQASSKNDVIIGLTDDIKETKDPKIGTHDILSSTLTKDVTSPTIEIAGTTSKLNIITVSPTKSDHVPSPSKSTEGVCSTSKIIEFSDANLMQDESFTSTSNDVTPVKSNPIQADVEPISKEMHVDDQKSSSPKSMQGSFAEPSTSNVKQEIDNEEPSTSKLIQDSDSTSNVVKEIDNEEPSTSKSIQDSDSTSNVVEEIDNEEPSTSKSIQDSDSTSNVKQEIDNEEPSTSKLIQDSDSTSNVVKEIDNEEPSTSKSIQDSDSTSNVKQEIDNEEPSTSKSIEDCDSTSNVKQEIDNEKLSPSKSIEDCDSTSNVKQEINNEKLSTSKSIQDSDEPPTSNVKQETCDVKPSTSTPVKLIPDSADEIHEITDSLGLLAESFRVMDDENDDDEDDDAEDPEDDDDDFDPYEESSSQMLEDLEDSSTSPPMGAKGLEPTPKVPEERESDEGTMDIVDDIECVENELPRMDLPDDAVSETPSTEDKAEKEDEPEIIDADTQKDKATDNLHGAPEKIFSILEKVLGHHSMTDLSKQPTSPTGNVLNYVEVESSDSDDVLEVTKSDVSADADVISVNIPEEVEVMSTSGTQATSEIVSKEGEVVISGVPKPPPLHKVSKINTSEVSIKTTGSSSPALHIPETTSVIEQKTPGEEIFNLDSDEEDTVEKKSPAKTEEKGPEEEKSPKTTDKKCINPQCKNEAAVYYQADRATAAYYSLTRRSAVVCEQCSRRASERSQALINGIKDFRPLLELEMEAPSQQLVEISDSDSEEETGDDTERIGEEDAQFLDDHLSDMINVTWAKYKLESRIKDTETLLMGELEKMQADVKEVDSMLDECQKTIDATRVQFYKDYEPRRKSLGAIVIHDTPFSSYSHTEKDLEEAVPETSVSRYPKRRGSSIASDTPAKKPAIPMGYTPLGGIKEEPRPSLPSDQSKADDDKEDISVVKLSAEAAPAELPPSGEITRPPLKAGMITYAMRNAFGTWLKGRIMDVQPKTAGQPFTQCRVKFEHKIKNPCKVLAARCLAYTEPCEVRMTIGTRVIALFKDPHNTARRESFYSGVVAEIPNPVNNYRYLVFFDDGYAQYVHHQHTRIVCESDIHVWEEVHPFIRDFIRIYLLSYPERPMVRLHAGEKLKTEWNGKWWDSKVLKVDASIALIHFDEDNRTEWIYRGSTRLAPLYLELKAAEKAGETRTRSRLPRSKAQMRSNMPCVEYTRSDEQTVAKTTAETQAQQQHSEEMRRQRSVAKKSTTPTTQAPTVVQGSPFEGVISRVVYYTPKNAVKPYKLTAHTCTAKCRRTDLLSLKDLRTYNPLAKPLLSGWERQTVRLKGHKVVMYRAPCGRRLRNMPELHKYLRILQSDLSVDLFDFTPGTHCLAEFVLNKCIVGKKDLSHGKENVPVPCVNYYDDSLPEFCSYNTERTPTAGVPLNIDPEFLCGCDCTDDCEDKSKCACWKMTLAGARTVGLDGPSVGYVYRRLPEPLPSGIYECNSRCKCKQTCLNRVAQHPLQLKLQVFKTINRGWGIRALNDVPKGSFLCVYAGNLLTDATANLDGLNEGDEYLAELDYIEVVEGMKEGYEDDVPDADKRLDKKSSDGSSGNESEPTSSESEDEREQSAKDGDFQPGYIPYSNIEFKKSLRKRQKLKKKEEKEKQKADAKKRDDCITISDDEEVREPSRFTAQAGMADKDLISKHSSRVSVRTLYGQDEACYIMDAKVQGNIGRYLNHSCHPNVFVQNVFVDTHDPRFPWVAFFALSHVRAGTELTWNYNYDIGSVPGKVLYCYCGAPNCRGRLL